MFETLGESGTIGVLVIMLLLIVSGVVAVKMCCQSNDFGDVKKAADSGVISDVDTLPKSVVKIDVDNVAKNNPGPRPPQPQPLVQGRSVDAVDSGAASGGQAAHSVLTGGISDLAVPPESVTNINAENIGNYNPGPQLQPLVQGRNVDRRKFSLPQIPSFAHLPHPFSYQELEDATNNFSTANLVGGGGFGDVYKGNFNGKLIAVKRLKPNSDQGEPEFKAEVEIMSRIHHRHLVSLVGYCMAEAAQRLLVYEFLPNDTLEKHLHGEGKPTDLDWATRLKIATGVARGLAYLHRDCNPRIIHRDIKSSNILLDENFEAKLSDFGLGKLVPDACSHVNTGLKGTFGYMAPEYASTGHLTEKSDVFSFGIVLLELITGRKPLVDNTMTLDKWAQPFLLQGKLDGLVDQRLGNDYIVNEMKVMVEKAFACVHDKPSKRPCMAEIVSDFDVLSRIDRNEESGDSGSIQGSNLTGECKAALSNQ
eukprot:Gb_17681 [translate_table: standard]